MLPRGRPRAGFAVAGHHARAVDPPRPSAEVRGAILDGPDGASLVLPLAHQRHHVLAPEFVATGPLALGERFR